jgi:hypothetical protein
LFLSTTFSPIWKPKGHYRTPWGKTYSQNPLDKFFSPVIISHVHYSSFIKNLPTKPLNF